MLGVADGRDVRRWWERLWFHPIINSPIVWGTFLAVGQLGRSVWLVGALTMRRATYDELGGARAALACGAGGYDDLGWSRTFTAHGKRAQLLVTGALGVLIVLAYVAIGRSAADLLAGRVPEPAGLFALAFALVVGATHCHWNRLPLRFAPFFLIVGLEVLVTFAATAWAGLRNRASRRDDELTVRVPPPL